MKDISKIDYSVLDRPEVLLFLFHPRTEPPGSAVQATGSERLIAVEKDILIPVEEDVVIGARFHMAKRSGANILFSTATVKLSPTMMNLDRYTTNWV